MSSIAFHGIQSRASTPPAEERVTSFFARAKKKVTKKESTWRDTPGFTLGGAGSLRRWRLRIRRGRPTAHGLSIASGYRRCCLAVSHFLAPTSWIGNFRDSAGERGVKPGAQRNVLSFLVTFFFARAKKEVTRSSAGGVEALLYKTIKMDSRLRGNDEQKQKAKREFSSCVG
jgi:hypothetical protein